MSRASFVLIHLSISPCYRTSHADQLGEYDWVGSNNSLTSVKKKVEKSLETLKYFWLSLLYAENVTSASPTRQTFLSRRNWSQLQVSSQTHSCALIHMCLQCLQVATAMEDHGALTKAYRWNKQKDDSIKYIEEEKRDIFVYLPMAFRTSRLIRSCCFHHVGIFWWRKVICLPRTNINCYLLLFLFQTKTEVLVCTIDYGKIMRVRTRHQIISLLVVKIIERQSHNFSL